MNISESRRTRNKERGRLRWSFRTKRDLRSNRYNSNRPRRDFAGHFGSTTLQVVSTVFGESIHQNLEKIKNEPYFQWPNRMGGDPTKHNQNLHF